MGAPLAQLVLVLALLPRIDGWIQYICISQPYMRAHSQNIHTTVHNAWYFHWHHWVSLPPSLWRSWLSWPVSFLMANLRYTTWTRPFTSTSCWPFSRGSMKNSPLSVRIRPDWKKKKIVSWVPPYLFKGIVIPLEPVSTARTIIWKEERHGGLTQVGLLKLSMRFIEWHQDLTQNEARVWSCFLIKHEKSYTEVLHTYDILLFLWI